jgi:hypothetical protein
MTKKIFCVICLLFVFFANNAQTPPKREFRAAWLATYANIDWPANGATTALEQSTFIQRMEEHRVTGMNAVFVQIRSQCDAMYPSPFEPWSADLTGTQGLAPNPYYDPLEFMIAETKKKGMEFHAWFNPYRALANASAANLAALSSSHIISSFISLFFVLWIYVSLGFVIVFISSVFLIFFIFSVLHVGFDICSCGPCWLFLLFVSFSLYFVRFVLFYFDFVYCA